MKLRPSLWTTVGNTGTLPPLVPASFYDSDEDDEDVNVEHVPADVYQHFGLPPGTPICLDSLPDPLPGKKPAYTYATLVKLAIWSSPQRKLTLHEIYDALEKRFSWFRERDNSHAWKTSIRHNLSLMAIFVKLPSDIHVPGKGCHWTVDLSKGEGYKRPRKRGPRKPQPIPEALSAEPPVLTSAPSSSESVTPVEQAHSWVGSPADWQRKEEHDERTSHELESSRDSAALAAASPDPQYRHYRMCTFLYPTQIGALSAGAKEALDLVAEAPTEVSETPPLTQNEPEGPAPWRGVRAFRVSRRSNPILKTFRRPRKLSDRPEGEYFCPSTASYLAYRAASAHGISAPYSNTTFVWKGYDAPAASEEASSDSLSVTQYRGSSPDDDKDSEKYTSKERTVKKFRFVDSGGLLERDWLGMTPCSASPPAESEFEEEDS